MTNLVTKTILASALSLALSSTAMANNCRSLYTQASNQLETMAAQAVSLQCHIGPSDPQRCVNDYRTARTQILRANSVSTDSGPQHVGPRGCAPGRAYVGNVRAQRTWICPPVTEKRFNLDLQLTGGHANQALIVEVCMIDPSTGNALRHFRESFQGAQANIGERFSKTTYGNATGLIPVIYLHKQVGRRGYRYLLQTNESGGEPANVSTARARIASLPSNKKRSK